ncbi:uncharacterized protein N7459_006600 [Penicillium hispanicum]|uniref:uncharacterized protein n=1 Tax=Penicillium hispanicum TaxID=1080232 RepID=UPI00253F6FA4|nr:uncharacterized protein N7459_006600 [Penicillium hispanicum]KAJ5577636.1 hypothetical protein N7459_006600 [Penicillium hispanicum]
MIYNPACAHCRQKRRESLYSPIHDRSKDRRNNYGLTPVHSPRLRQYSLAKGALYPFQGPSLPAVMLGDVPNPGPASDPGLPLTDPYIHPDAYRRVPSGQSGQGLEYLRDEQLPRPSPYLDRPGMAFDTNIVSTSSADESHPWTSQPLSVSNQVDWLPPTPASMGPEVSSPSSPPSTSVYADSSAVNTGLVFPADTLFDSSPSLDDLLSMSDTDFLEIPEDARTQYPTGNLPTDLPDLFESPSGASFDFALGGIGGESLFLQ